MTLQAMTSTPPDFIDQRIVVDANHVVNSATSFANVLYAIRDDGTLLWKQSTTDASLYFAIGAPGTLLALGYNVPMIALQ